MEKTEKINPAEIELADWKEMELASIEQCKTGQKIIIAASTLLRKAEIMILSFGGETERELLSRVRNENAKKKR